MSKEISIVIPVYDAQEIVEKSVALLIDFCQSQGWNFEILLRDDGSQDASARLLEEIQQQNSHVSCFFNIQNRGLGFTLRKLFEHARYEQIVCLDCDLPFSERVLNPLTSNLQDHDIVVASRYKDVQNHIPLARKVTSRLYYLFCKWLFRISVKDLGSGSFAFRKEILPVLALEGEGFDFHIEFFAKAKKQGLSVFEIGYPFSPLTQKGSFGIFRHGPKVFLKTCEWSKKINS